MAVRVLPQYISVIDEFVSTEAGRYIASEGPDLSWIYLQYTDDAGHSFGDGPQLDEAVRLMRCAAWPGLGCYRQAGDGNR